MKARFVEYVTSNETEKVVSLNQATEEELIPGQWESIQKTSHKEILFEGFLNIANEFEMCSTVTDEEIVLRDAGISQEYAGISDEEIEELQDQ